MNWSLSLDRVTVSTSNKWTLSRVAIPKIRQARCRVQGCLDGLGEAGQLGHGVVIPPRPRTALSIGPLSKAADAV